MGTMTDIPVLVVDDDRNARESLASILSEEGYEAVLADGGQEAIDLLRARAFKLAIVDLKMPRVDGLAVLSEARALRPECGLIMITAYPTVETAVVAMKQGAADYITKPFNPDEILLVMSKVMEHKRLATENRQLRQQLEALYSYDDIVVSTEKMSQVLQLVRRVAPTPSTVLILGESGTGKELIAHAVHQLSLRRERPFVSVNCAELPGELLESELFGHERGAFTGAVKAKPGKFELADRGTIYLDEIADMSAPLQAKILRVLQEQRFERVGGTHPLQVDVRVVAATNRDLGALVKTGEFREDLYFRLNVILIELPPLRDRGDDVELLADHFLERFNSRMRKRVEGISPEAMKLLRRYSWPGNVRELENVIERAVVLVDDREITPAALPRELVKSPDGVENAPVDAGTLAEHERRLIVEALRRTRGNQKRAAEDLGIGRNTLWRKVRRLGLEEVVKKLKRE